MLILGFAWKLWKVKRKTEEVKKKMKEREKEEWTTNDKYGLFSYEMVVVYLFFFFFFSFFFF